MPQNIINFPIFWLRASYCSVPLRCYYTNIFMSINYEYAFLFRSNVKLCLVEIPLPKNTVQFHYVAFPVTRTDTTSKITTTDFDLHQKTLKSWLYSNKTGCMYRRHPSEASLKWVFASIYCMHGACHIFKDDLHTEATLASVYYYLSHVAKLEQLGQPDPLQHDKLHLPVQVNSCLQWKKTNVFKHIWQN